MCPHDVSSFARAFNHTFRLLIKTSRLRFALQQHPISIKESRFVSSEALWNYTRLEPGEELLYAHLVAVCQSLLLVACAMPGNSSSKAARKTSSTLFARTKSISSWWNKTIHSLFSHFMYELGSLLIEQVVLWGKQEQASQKERENDEGKLGSRTTLLQSPRRSLPR